MKKVDVVIPVYDGYAETIACIESTVQTVDAAWARIVVVNDSSPDPEITAYLRRLAPSRALAAVTPGAVWPGRAGVADGAGKVGLVQVGATQVGFGQVGGAQVGFGQVGAEHIR